jgi:branched-chain amino acid transport system permease protein
MEQLLASVVVGVSIGMPIFLIASGLTLTYGVMHVLNFAHGGFFMYGAFLAASVVGARELSVWEYLGVVLLGAAFCGLLALACERLVFRNVTEHYSGLLVSFALLLFLTGVVEEFWGGNTPRTVRPPRAVVGTVDLFGAQVPVYNLYLIGLGLVIAVLIHLVLRGTWAGRTMRAVAADPQMAAALGIRARRVGIAVFVVGGVLAGIAGVTVAPTVTVDYSLGQAFILQAFVAILVGGLGSVSGALVASVGIGLLDALSTAYLPSVSAYALYIGFGAAMLVRPSGIFPPSRAEKAPA